MPWYGMKFGLPRGGRIVIPFVCAGVATLAALATPAWAGCPRERHVFHGRMEGWGAWQPDYLSRWIYANRGDRLVLAVVGTNPRIAGVPAALAWELRIFSNTSQRIFVGPRTTTGDRVVFDMAAPENGAYVGIVRHTNARVWGDVFHATFDVSDPGECGPPGYQLDFCFGAIGPNCAEGIESFGGLFIRSDRAWDGMRRMDVSLGSMTHDTCCSRAPRGVWCQGAFNRGDGRCAREWDEAAYPDQMWANPRRNFSHLFNPSVPTYPPHRIAELWARSATNYIPYPYGLAFPDGHEINRYAQNLFGGPNRWCRSGYSTRHTDFNRLCCGLYSSCPLDGRAVQVPLDCSFKLTAAECAAAPHCQWYPCSESTAQMKADPICMPRGTSIDVACPVRRSESCRDKTTESACLQAAPRCIWVASTARCHLRDLLEPPGT